MLRGLAFGRADSVHAPRAHVGPHHSPYLSSKADAQEATMTSLGALAMTKRNDDPQTPFESLHDTEQKQLTNEASDGS